MDPETAKFVRAACATPLLTREQEASVFARVSAGDQEARHEAVRANVRLVVALAQKYSTREVSVEDLIQSGVVALYTAVDKFDPSRRIKFATYSIYWILKAFLVDLKTTSLIGVPAHLWSLDGPVPPAVLKILSLDDPRLTEDEDSRPTSLGDVVPARQEESDEPGAEEERQARVRKLREAVDRLPPRLRVTVALRFGMIEGRQPMTLEAVGEYLGISHKAVDLRVQRAIELLPGLMIGED